MQHLSFEELAQRVDVVRESPDDDGRVELIVRRPVTNEREVVTQGELTCEEGLVGDKWRPGRSGKRDSQLTLMNARFAALVAGGDERRELAGDQLYVDLDLSEQNLPAGTRLLVGDAVIEISELPHLGCHKFAARFGDDAHLFVNSDLGRPLRLRGANARVLTPGIVRTGDPVRKLET